MFKDIGTILKIMLMLIIVVILLKLCLVFLWPFFISLLFVFLIEPVVQFLCRFRISRKIAVVMGFFIIMALIVGIGIYLSRYAFYQMLALFHNIPRVVEILNEKLNILNGKNIDYLQITNTFEQILLSYKSKIVSTIITTLNSFIYIVVIFMTTIFLSMDFDKIIGKIKGGISGEFFRFACNVIIKIEQIIKVEIKLIFMTSLQTVLGLYVLGFKNSLTIGIICGILDLLPVVGPSLIFIPWIIYEFVVGEIFLGIGLTCLYLLLQINRQIMEIKFVGGNLKIPPVLTIFSLYIGIILYGLWGVIFGPILTIMVVEFLKGNYERRKFYEL